MPPSEQRQGISQSEVFSIAFGAAVGVGWVIGFGDWIRLAGPVGSIIAFVLGGSLILLVGYCYLEMARLFPVSGGEVVYAYQMFGLHVCYWTAWLLTFAWVGTVIFESIVVGRIVGAMVPAVNGPTLYLVGGEPVQAGTLACGLAGTAFFTYLNYLGIQPSARFQEFATYSRFALLALVVVVAVLFGKLANLQPPFAASDHRIAMQGILAVALTVPFWITGFNAVSQVVGERRSEVAAGRVGWTFQMANIAVIFFYITIIIACSMTLPWQKLIHLNVPAANGFATGLHLPIVSATVLSVGVLGAFTVWNSSILAGARVLYSLGAARILPHAFGTFNAIARVPRFATIFIGIVSALGVFFGRGGILPFIDVTSSCMAAVFVVVSAALVKFYLSARDLRRGTVPRFLIASGSAIASVAFLYLSLYQPYVDAGHRIPLHWIVFFVWICAGLILWMLASTRRVAISEAERRGFLDAMTTERPGEGH